MMNKIRRLLDHFIYKLNLGVGYVFAATLILLAIFVFLNVVSRYIGVSIPWLFSMSVVILIVFAFLSMAYTLGEGKHIRVDVLTSVLPEAAQVPLEILGYIFCLFFAIVLGFQGSNWLYFVFILNAMPGSTTFSTLPVPFWIFVLPVPVGSFLLILQSIRLIIKRSSFLVNQVGIQIVSLVPVVTVVMLSVMGILIALYLNPIGGLFIALITLLIGGIPVFSVLGNLGILGLYFFAGGSSGLSQVPITAFSVVESFPLVAMPLYVLIGAVLGEGGLTVELFRFTESWFGRIRGSLLIVTIITGAFLCALTGSSIAATALLAVMCLPALIERGYDTRLACGTVGGASAGSLIPPSIPLILYGTLVEVSIGKLFMAALFPSLIIFAIFAIYVVILSYTNKEKFGEKTEICSWKEKFIHLKAVSVILPLPILILGGIYFGFFTATEAAGVAVVYGFIAALGIKRTLTLKGFKKSILDSSNISSMMLAILMGGMLFATVVSQLKLTPSLVALTESFGISQLGITLVMSSVLLIGGMFMNVIPLLLITLPVFFPVAVSAGIDPLWLGVFYVICIETGLLTPPVGPNLFVIRGISEIPFIDITMGLLPFIFILIIGILIIYIFPQLCTWLPSTMF